MCWLGQISFSLFAATTTIINENQLHFTAAVNWNYVLQILSYCHYILSYGLHIIKSAILVSLCLHGYSCNASSSFKSVILNHIF